MQITQRTTRSMALIAGGVLAVSSLHPTPARADKSSNYKAGAVGLGVAAGALILKGKTLPGVLAGIGAYYAYKKGQDTKHDQNYAQYPDNRNNGGYAVDNGGYANGEYNNDGQGRDANAGYDYNGDNRNGATNNQDGNGYNRPDDNRDGNNGNYQDNGGYRPADNYPTYNDGANYPTQQTYNQTEDGGYQQNENSDVTDYNHPTTSQSNGNEPNYGYRAFSQANSRHSARHGQ